MKGVSVSAAASGLPAGEIETKVALIQALIPLGPHAVGEAFEAEVVALAGHATVGRAGKQAWSAGGSKEARSTWPIRNCPSLFLWYATERRTARSS